MKHNFTGPTPFHPNVFIINVSVDAVDIEDSTSPPPEVGSNTSWRLTFHRSHAPDASVFPGNPQWIPDLHALRSGGVIAYVPERPPDQPDVVPLYTGEFWGTMLGGSTPDGLPITTGTVIGLEIRSVLYQEIRPQQWIPLPGKDTFRRMSSSPKWFHRDELTSGVSCRMDTGLVVQIAVHASGD